MVVDVLTVMAGGVWFFRFEKQLKSNSLYINQYKILYTKLKVGKCV